MTDEAGFLDPFLDPEAAETTVDIADARPDDVGLTARFEHDGPSETDEVERLAREAWQDEQAYADAELIGHVQDAEDAL